MKNFSLRTSFSLIATLTSLSLMPTAFAAKNSSLDMNEKHQLRAWKQHQTLEQNSLFHGLQWRNVGPTLQGGRVIDVESPIDDPYTFYVAFASGGLWKTTNNGDTFTPLFDDQATLVMGDVAIAPKDKNVIWVGTGEDNSSRSSYGGLGVYKSEDGGKTWAYKGLGDSNRIGRIVIDPRDSNHVYVATLGKLYTKGGQRGVYETKDGGETWTEVLEGDATTGFVDLVMHPTNPDILYAAAWERSRKSWDFVEGGEGSAVWKTTDGGKNWRKVMNGLPQGEHVGRIGLTVSAAAPDVVYASVDNQSVMPKDFPQPTHPLSPKAVKSMSVEAFLKHTPAQIDRFIRYNDLDTTLDAHRVIKQLKSGELTLDALIADIEQANPRIYTEEVIGLEIYRSDDAAGTWRKTHDGPLRKVYSSYGYYFGQIKVAPNDPDRVYVMGVTIIRSDDGGKSWMGIDAPHVHADFQALWIDPKHPERIIAGNDGGVDISHDGGKHWTIMDHLPVGQFYTVNVDMAQPYNVYGGLQDNGTWRGPSNQSWENTKNWKRLFGGDGMHVAVDPRDNVTTYFGYQFGNSYRQDNSGINDVRPRDELSEDAYRYNWNSPLILSPHSPEIIYFGANKLMRSMDKGDSWTAISPDMTTSKSRGDVPFASITTISESPKQFGVIWVGTDDGNVRVTANSGVSWVKTTRKLPKNRWVSRVEASHFDVNRAYVSLNGYRNDDIRAYIYRTDNLGKSWVNIANNLPNEPINVVKEDPFNEDVLYVGTDHGVYVSIDRGDSWQAIDIGLPNVATHDLVIHPRERELVVGTHGRSIWIADVLPIQELTKAVRQSPVHIFHIDPARVTGAWSQHAPIWNAEDEAAPEKSFNYWVNANGQVDIAIHDMSGNRLFAAKQAATKGINCFVWNMQVDESLALSAEKQKNAAKASLTNADQPYHVAKKYGYPLFVAAGDYTLEVTINGESQTRKFTVKGAPAPKTRSRKQHNYRGK